MRSSRFAIDKKSGKGGGRSRVGKAVARGVEGDDDDQLKDKPRRCEGTMEHYDSDSKVQSSTEQV
jgi:hypothetical protein